MTRFREFRIFTLNTLDFYRFSAIFMHFYQFLSLTFSICFFSTEVSFGATATTTTGFNFSFSTIFSTSDFKMLFFGPVPLIFRPSKPYWMSRSLTAGPQSLNLEIFSEKSIFLTQSGCERRLKVGVEPGHSPTWLPCWK